MTVKQAIDDAQIEDNNRRDMGQRTLTKANQCRLEMIECLVEVLKGSDPLMAEAAGKILDGPKDMFFSQRFTARFGDALVRRTNDGTRTPYAWRIRLSAPLWERMGYAERRDTIRHEVAHLIANTVACGSGHGDFWKLCAIACGAKPKKFGPPIPRADIKRKQSRYAAKCGCRTHMITMTRLNKILTGKRKYSCRLCKVELTVGI